MRRSHKTLLLTALLLIFSGLAFGDTITVGNGGSFTVDYNACSTCSPSVTVVNGFTAEIKYYDFAFSYDPSTDKTNVTFKADVNNTSSSDSRITSMAFTTNPNLLTSPAPTVSGAFSSVVVTTHFSYGLNGQIEFCFITNSNNCTGGQNGGINDGDTGSILASLYFPHKITSLEFDSFFLKYQSVTTSGTRSSSVSLGGIGTIVPVPEPASLTLLGTGLTAAALRLRRKSK